MGARPIRSDAGRGLAPPSRPAPAREPLINYPNHKPYSMRATMRRATVHDFEVPDLFAAMVGKPEPETDEETEDLEQQCINDFGIDFYGLAEIAERLLPLCEHAYAAISGAPARGFAIGGRFICKVYDEDPNA